MQQHRTTSVRVKHVQTSILTATEIGSPLESLGRIIEFMVQDITAINGQKLFSWVTGLFNSQTTATNTISSCPVKLCFNETNINSL